MSSLGVVLDTNVLLSGLAYPASVPGRLVAAWRFGALEVVLSEFMLQELRRTLPRLSHRHGLDQAASDDLHFDALTILVELVEPQVVRDSDLSDHNDLPVLGTLLAALQLGSAQVLITGDRALLALRERYPIRTPAEFWAEHGGLRRRGGLQTPQAFRLQPANGWRQQPHAAPIGSRSITSPGHSAPLFEQSNKGRRGDSAHDLNRGQPTRWDRAADRTRGRRPAELPRQHPG